MLFQAVIPDLSRSKFHTKGERSIEIPDDHHAILELHLKPEKFKTRVTKLGVLYVLHVITTNIPPKF